MRWGTSPLSDLSYTILTNGLQVAITYISNEDAAKSVVSKLEAAGAKGVAIRADMADPSAGSRIVKETMEAFSSDGIDILGITVIPDEHELSLTGP
jgi:hypothetical protein